MRYLIYTEGNVINQQGKSYMVNAPTEKVAQEQAKIQFIKEYGYNGEIYTGKTRELKNFTGISIISMVIAILLSFINWKSDHATVSIKPDLISCIMAFAIYSAYVIRIKGLQRMTDYIDLVFMVLTALLFSSFIQCILLNSTFKFIIWNVTIDCRLLLIMAAFLSWLGMKMLSAGCMLIILICAFIKILVLNRAMGNLWGPVYAICAGVGIITYLLIEPAVQEMIPYYHNCAQRAMRGMKKDISEVGSEAQIFGKSIEEYAKQSTVQMKKSFAEGKKKYQRQAADKDANQINRKITLETSGYANNESDTQKIEEK